MCVTCALIVVNFLNNVGVMVRLTYKYLIGMGIIMFNYIYKC